MNAGEDDDPPTFSRPPPGPGGCGADDAVPGMPFSVAPHRAPSFSTIDARTAKPKRGDKAEGEEEEEEDGPPTDVDDGPPTFSVAPAGPGREVGDVTLVNAAPPHERLCARVVTADAAHVFVKVDGEPAARRISRTQCFEHPVGGGWSSWRLSGADRARWMIAVPIEVGEATS